ncbi:EAL domain-containing protein, partial [Rhodoferax sp.]|uniref:bifunctional diguanylate cyclase/phosphodiesterase n=1 Tax=Rhodoferax sp. TaxID=50421 RepID=UPI00262E502D
FSTVTKPVSDSKQLSLRSQIGLAVAVILIITMVLQAYLLYTAARDKLRTSLSQQLEVLVQQVGNELDDKLMLRAAVLQSMAAKFPADRIRDVRQVEQYFRDSPNLTHLIDDFYLFSPQGVLLVDWPIAKGRRGLDMTDRDYIQAAMRKAPFMISKPILGRSTKQPMVVISAPILNAKGELLGILGGVVNLKKTLLLKPLYDTSVGEHGYFYLVGPERLTIMHPNQDRLLKPITPRGANPYLDRALDEHADGTVEGTNSAGLKGLFSFMHLPHTGWVLAAVLPSSEAFASISDLRGRSGVFTALSLIIALAVVLLLVRRFTQPLETLTQFLNAQQNDTDIPKLPHSCRETNQLATAFEGFVNQQKSTQHMLEVAARRAEEANADWRIAAAAFESQEGIYISSVEAVILRVNHAFTHITGYSAEEAVGQTHQLLRSNRHTRDFYKSIKAAIADTGVWQGEVQSRHKNGTVFPTWQTVTAVKNEQHQVTHYVVTLTDISERKAAEAKIESLAFFDPLTLLPNRRLLLDRLHLALANSARHGLAGALLFIDLDNFKVLNDTLGHAKGDMLLQIAAKRLVNCVREGDSVARLGGDEFVVVLQDLDRTPALAAAQAKVAAEKIITALNQPYILGEHNYHNTPSVGVALFYDHQRSAEELMQHADLAMYDAKRTGRNTLRFFDPQMQISITARARLEKDLHLALALSQFFVLYQPQVDSSGRLTGAEALVRWQHPERGAVNPVEFIPLAEDTGLIVPLGQWVLEQACQQVMRWSNQRATDHLTVAVNVSAVQFRQTNFVQQVEKTLTRTGVSPQRIKLELTESILANHLDDIIEKMTQLKALGLSFSLDDFGTGYSSLSYLKRLPLDQLKIDRSFVKDILTDPNDAAIAGTIVALAHSLSLSVIAEGVETLNQKEALSRLGCFAYQGYFFGRPMSAADLETLASCPANFTD